jgi:seryl-tRNA synthetase
MHDIKDIIRRPDYYKQGLSSRGLDGVVIDHLADMYLHMVQRDQDVEQLQAEINATSRNIAEAKRDGRACDELMLYAAVLKELMPLAEMGVLGGFIEECRQNQ